MKKYFKGCTTDKDNGWMQLSTGNSCIDDLDYVLTTECLHGDQVPEIMQDAKNASHFIAGLLNCYFNDIDATKLEPEQVAKSGLPNDDRNIPSPLNTLIPF